MAITGRMEASTAPTRFAALAMPESEYSTTLVPNSELSSFTFLYNDATMISGKPINCLNLHLQNAVRLLCEVSELGHRKSSSSIDSSVACLQLTQGQLLETISPYLGL